MWRTSRWATRDRRLPRPSREQGSQARSLSWIGARPTVRRDKRFNSLPLDVGGAVRGRSPVVRQPPATTARRASVANLRLTVVAAVQQVGRHAVTRWRSSTFKHRACLRARRHRRRQRGEGSCRSVDVLLGDADGAPGNSPRRLHQDPVDQSTKFARAAGPKSRAHRRRRDSRRRGPPASSVRRRGARRVQDSHRRHLQDQSGSSDLSVVARRTGSPGLGWGRAEALKDQ